MPRPLPALVFTAWAFLGTATGASASSFKDVLDTPAMSSALASSSPLTGIAAAGHRLVAVGLRGHIVYSDNAGKSWRQASVPVSSDLTAVHVPTPLSGWAVGHDGVVLHSTDGGRTWTRQLDGRQVNALLNAYYKTDSSGADPAMARVADEVRRLTGPGPDQPFLDVWFENETTGYVVGAFNLFLATRDGGRSWQPLMELTDNPDWLHLYAVRGIGGAVYIVGEQGLVLRRAPGNARFAAVPTPYKGTFFGITGTADTLVAFGLRGNVVQSEDQGRSWKQVDTGIGAGITGGTVLRDGRIVLVSQGGQMLVGGPGGAYARCPVHRPVPLFGVAPAATGLALVGARGVQMQSLTH